MLNVDDYKHDGNAGICVGLVEDEKAEAFINKPDSILKEEEGIWCTSGGGIAQNGIAKVKGFRI